MLEPSSLTLIAQGQLGALGSAMIFICLLAFVVIIGAVVLGYAAHCLLVVVEQTAAGSDEIVWPDEPFLDWAGKVVFLAWLVAFWFVPLGFYLRFARPTFLPDALGVRFLVLSIPLLWLLFPISLLSMLGASSRWVFLNPLLLPGLLRCGGTLLVVYIVSAILLGGSAALWYASLAGTPLVLPLAAVATATTILVYGRLLGRLAKRLGSLKPVASKPAPAVDRKTRKAITVEDPWSQPPPPPPKAKQAARKKSKPEGEGYGLAEEESRNPNAVDHSDWGPPGRPVDESKKERKQRSRTSARTPRSLLTGVLEFPWYPKSRKTWGWLTGGFLLIGGAACALVQFYPH